MLHGVGALIKTSFRTCLSPLIQKHLAHWVSADYGSTTLKKGFVLRALNRFSSRVLESRQMASESYVAAIDQGTTSTRFIIYDQNARAVASHQLEFSQLHPQVGWVEHDPVEILDTVRTCMQEALKEAAAAGLNVEGNMKGVGITNQRETTVVWSRTTGKPLHNAIVWMDGRTSSICRRLEKELGGGRNHFREVTGLPISTYFSALKLIWLLENDANVRTAVDNEDALFGTIDTWLIWNLTGTPFGSSSGGQRSSEVLERVHVTDCSNAARTLLMDIRTLQWHEPTLKDLGIPRSVLPKIVSNSEVIGSIAEGWPLAGIPLAGCLGDQHAAMLGQRCKIGEAKSTYGTGCFILLNTGTSICSSSHGLLTTVAFKLGQSAATTYALEGSIAIAGAAVRWLRDGLGLITSASEVEELASSVPDCGGVYFVPAFSGLFAPWWRDDARGVCVGISGYTTKGHLARAVLESMCFQACDVLEAMHKDAGAHGMQNEADFVLLVDGGATANNLLLQLQADILGSEVVRPADIETTALGAAFAAGLAVNMWSEADIFEGDVFGKARKSTFMPATTGDDREARIKRWRRAVSRSFDLAD